jgi:hypothetical protein
MFLSRACLIALALVAVTVTASAQNGVHNVGTYFLRGKLVAISGGQITVAPHSGGAPVTVPIREGWTVGVISPADESVLAVGRRLNIVELDMKSISSDLPRALYVDHFVGRDMPPATAPFPEPGKGPGGAAGVITKGRNWAQMPGRDEFGAWGALGRVNKVEKVAGGYLVVTELSEGLHTSFVPTGTRIVHNTPGQQSDVKVGDNVHVLLTKEDGKEVARRILVGANGTIPPM